jgi:UDP:flavonoid glycosyltransferase YjiC (YdhE family)
LKVLFAVASWGLGHATRDLVLIRALLAAGHQVTVLSSERALHLLKGELGERCSYLEVRDIPKTLGHTAVSFYLKVSLAMPIFFWTFRHEHRVVREVNRTERFDRIISDSRYGVWLPDVPSYFLLHTLHQIIPGRPYELEKIAEGVQRRLFAGAHKVIVPDQEVDGLAGDLCHHLSCFRREELEYIGILSSVRRRPLETDVDYFITVSGAEPQRSVFERKVLRQARDLKGRVVISLGKPDVPLSVRDDGRVAVHSFMNRSQQEEMLNRARMVVSRSGYTTLMELAELGKRALLVPTVGQSEQEYLGAYHEKLGNMHTVAQSRLVLARDVEAAGEYRGLSLCHRTEDSVRRFLRLIEE